MAKNEIISPYFENGVFAGIRVTLGDEDFVIAPKDYQNGNEMPCQEAMTALKIDGLDTWNYRQICLIMAYCDEIDEELEKNGGDSLDNVYWTSAECSDTGSFSYSGYGGTLNGGSKTYTFSVRAIKNLKNS